MSHADDVSLSPPSVSTTGATSHDLQVLQGQLQAAEFSAAQARRLFTHAPTPMLLVTSAGLIVDANRQAGVLFGVPVERLTGRALTKYLSPAAHSTLHTLLKTAFGQNGPQRAELVLTSPDGTVRTLRVDAAQDEEAAEAADGAAWAHLVLTDITDLRNSHAQLLDHADLLQVQVQEQAARRYRVESEAQEVLRATQAQLNLHLARVQNLLKRHVKTGGASPDLTLAQDALTVTVALLESLDRYVQARQLRVRLRSVDLNQVLREVKGDLDGQLRGRVVEWSSGPLPTVYGDSRALRMILTAYLSNALKFTRTREVTQIRLVVEEQESEYLIGVKDNGVGFNNRLRETAFELFGRLHKTGTYEGSGVDLAMVRQVCDVTGGRAWCEAKVDHGAIFWLSCARPPG